MIHLIWWYFEYYDYDHCDTSDMKMLMIIMWDITFLPFPFDIIFVAAQNWIDNLQEGSCRGLAILSAVKNPGFIRSWGRGGGSDEGDCFLLLLPFCSLLLSRCYVTIWNELKARWLEVGLVWLDGRNKIRPVHAGRWHQRWSTRFNGTTARIRLKHTPPFSLYHHNFLGGQNNFCTEIDQECV